MNQITPNSNSSLSAKEANRNILKQTLWVWFFSMLGLRGIHELQRIPFFRDYTMVLTAVVLIYVPLWIMWRRKERLEAFEKTGKALLYSVAWFVGASVVIFPIMEVLNRYFQDFAFGLHFVGGNYQGLAKVALFQLVLVAIPEEFFYRGYMQPQLNRIWGRPYRFLGARFGKGLIITSILFALSHSIIMLQWWHFSIFFPSLMFGWLRERTGYITASSLFHTLSNVFSYWVIYNYR